MNWFLILITHTLITVFCRFFLCNLPVRSYALLHTNYFFVCVFFYSLSVDRLYVCVYVFFSFSLSSKCIFIYMQLRLFLVCLLLGLMQRYRCLYVAVQQWSTKFHIFNTQNETDLVLNLHFFRVEQANSSSTFFFFNGLTLCLLFVLSVFKVHSVVFLFCTIDNIRRVCVCACENLFCCYNIIKNQPKKKLFWLFCLKNTWLRLFSCEIERDHLTK